MYILLYNYHVQGLDPCKELAMYVCAFAEYHNYNQTHIVLLHLLSISYRCTSYYIGIEWIIISIISIEYVTIHVHILIFTDISVILSYSQWFTDIYWYLKSTDIHWYISGSHWYFHPSVWGIGRCLRCWCWCWVYVVLGVLSNCIISRSVDTKI